MCIYIFKYVKVYAFCNPFYTLFVNDKVTSKKGVHWFGLEKLLEI